MLGRHSPQGELFRPDNVHLQHVGRDSLYGFLAEQRHRLFRDEVVAKVMPRPKRKGVEYTAADFDVDFERGVATCPAGQSSSSDSRDPKTGERAFGFSRKHCSNCQLRGKCTTAKTSARKLHLSGHYRQLEALRELQQTADFKARYRRCTKVEHRIARLEQLGIRQARYFGRAKVAYQLAVAATVRQPGAGDGGRESAASRLVGRLGSRSGRADRRNSPGCRLSCRRFLQQSQCRVRQGRTRAASSSCGLNWGLLGCVSRGPADK